ncbi:MAG: amino acid adenylation domain-containing protein [Myxococcales bacterium]|nr:amino acid adenylation domain-containing protein [Myxococcales bacterium]MCB9715265.1 amino acid adenylation domain-containing protein [Myxococcales bacterium]
MAHDFSLPRARPPGTEPADAMARERARVVATWCLWWYRYRGGRELALGDDEPPALAIAEGDTANAVLDRLRPRLGDATTLVLRSADPQGHDGQGPRVTIEASDEGWLGRIEGLPDDVPTAVRERMPQQLLTLLDELGRDPARDVDVLPLLSAEEAATLVEQWTGPRAPSQFAPVTRDIRSWAARRPDAVAIQGTRGSIRYGELVARVDRVARWLDDQGIGDGDRVAVLMDNCIEAIVSMLAIFEAGAAYVPLDPSYPRARIETILDEVRPKAVLVEHSRASVLPSPDAHRLLRVDELLEREPVDPRGALGREPGPDQVAYLVYTSGTTGRPKGVMLSHDALAHYIEVARSTYGYHEGDVIPAMARLSFSISFFELLSPLACGARLRLLSRDEVLDLRGMQEVLAEATCIHASPSWWRKLLASLPTHPPAPGRFDGLRHVSSGGDMVPPDVLEAMKRTFPRAEVFVIYGSSEIACMGCSYPVPRDRTLTRTRVGRPFPNMSVQLLDPAGHPVPPGFRGEVCFGGRGLTLGYLDQPELTAAKLVETDGQRLYHMGDLGIFEDDYQLRLLGRSDFQIKLRGIRIEPAEIETHLRSMPGIRDAVVSAFEPPGGDKRLVAYLVLAEGQPLDSRALREALRERLPEAMVPSLFVRLDALPVNHNNKVDRRALPPPEPQPDAEDRPGAAPRSEGERRLLELWRRVLGQGSLGIHDDFFDRGGDSLTGAELMTQIDHQLGVPLPVSELLRHPTVAELAPRLEPEQRARTERSAVVQLRPGSARPAFFFIHDGEGETIVYRNLARDLPPGCPVYGVHPKRSGLRPILHTRIAEMVEYYADEIIKTCSGPYVVGGLCIGGFLAFEVARALRARGESVPLVALLDAPHVLAPKRGASARRLASLGSSLGGISEQRASLGQRLARVATTVARKAYNTASYELRSRAQRQATSARIRATRLCLDHDLPLPPALEPVGVDPMLRFAEREYEDPGVYEGALLLVRATRRDPALDGTWVDDTPYSEIIDAPNIGWDGRAAALAVEDVDAGHSSMLQQRMAPTVAAIIGRHLRRVLGPAAEAGPIAGEHEAEDERITAFVDGCSLVVVMVSYRTPTMVVDALASLEPERPAHRDLRVVVVDNTCGDDGPAIAAEIERRGWSSWATVRISARNGGFAYGNNVAIRSVLRASRPPPYVWLLNPDTRVEPGASRALVEVLDGDPQAGLAGSCLVEPDGRVWGRAFRFPSLLGELEAATGLGPLTRLLSAHVVARTMGERAEPVDWISGASVMIRREAIETTGLFDEGYFLYYEETDFCRNARRGGWRAWYVPASRVVHIAGSSTGMSSWLHGTGRIPKYFFDSRRRYFLKNHGLAYATMTDLARLSGLGTSWVVGRLRLEDRPRPSRLLRDSLRAATLLEGPSFVPRR